MKEQHKQRITGCFGPQPCFGGCGFSSQMDRGRHPVSGQREGRREEETDGSERALT